MILMYILILKRGTMLTDQKQICLRVAQSLIRIGEKQKALDMIESIFSEFPIRKFSIDMDDVYFANLYYKAEETKSANKLVENIAKIYVRTWITIIYLPVTS